MNSYQTSHLFNNLLPFYFVRSFVHLLVLVSLLIHQFLFQAFIDADLSIQVYSLCSFVLFIDALCLFFYREHQKPWPFILFFIDALFLSGLLAIMGPSSLFFILLLVFIQCFPFFLFGKIFQPLVFLFYLSILFPVALLWQEKISFDDRLSLTVFINVVLFFMFFSAWFFKSIFQLFEARRNLITGAYSEDFSDLKPSNEIGMSLDLTRKLKPILNSLIKYFPESQTDTDKEIKHSVLPSFFSPQKGKHQLEQMRKFVLGFIEYAEPEIDSLTESVIDLKELLIQLLKKLEKHSQRPEHLIQKLDFQKEFKIKGSAVHLSKCFEHILVNSFEALKNQEKPEINVQGYFEKMFLVLEFSDNGHGIESEDIKKLFNPLFSKRFGLRGLGLAYVQKIIKAHKASLDIVSSNKGTKVVIKFPINFGFYDSRKFKLFKRSDKKIA